VERDLWQSFYASDLQSLWLLILVPALFLLGVAWRPLRPGSGADPEHAGFVRGFAIVFAAQTILDPICTGPLVRALGAPAAASTAVMLLFVLLGDLRVFLLIFGLLDPGPLRRTLRAAALWTLLVPAASLPVYAAMRAVWPGLAMQWLWLVYEAAFAALALWLRGRVVPRRAGARPALSRYLRGVALYVAAYYALWAAADALILIGGLDLGWLLRVIPNQLYYAFFVPLVYFTFFFRRSAAGETVTARAPGRA
jgi:hypothetical protein